VIEHNFMIFGQNFDVLQQKTLKQAMSNLTIWRWVFLVLMALGELTWLSIRIVAPETGLLSYTQGIPSIFVTSLAVVIILGWARCRGRLLELPFFQEFPHRSWPFVLSHLVSFAAFFFLTIFIFEDDLGSSNFYAIWIIAWAATGLGTGVFWMFAAMPAKKWIRLIRQNSSLVSAGIVIIVASWVLGYLANRSWSALQGPTLLIVQWMLQSFQQDVICQPAAYLIGTSLFSVRIFPVCAGYEGIGLMAVFVGIYFWLFRRRLRFPQVFILFPFAILIMWILNAVRIASLILVGTYVSPEVATGGFHSEAGWLSFVGVSLGMVAVTQRMQFFSIKSESSAKFEPDTMHKVEGRAEAGGQAKVETVAEADRVNPTLTYLGPLMALLALTMITRMFSNGFDWLYPARVLGTAIAIWFLWRSLVSRLKQTRIFSWSAVGIGVAVFVIWILLEKAFGGPDTGASIAENLGKASYGLAATWLVFRVLGSVVIAPIAEELAFRGYLLRRLLSTDFENVSSPDFTWLSFLGSSILFGAMHGRWLAGTLAGMFYAWAMYRRGRIADSIIAHATTNALIGMEVLILGHWGLWN
jgi:exosortase E/protease (VPEID-CTERM system)